MKLIDKNAAIAKIEARCNECLKRAKIIDAEYWNGKADAYRDMLVVLDTLEVKEVDLDEEIKRFTMSKELYETKSVIRTVAKHFFELGLKAQNMITPLQQQRISVMKMEFWTGLQTFSESEMTLSDAYNEGIEDVLEELGFKAQKGE